MDKELRDLFEEKANNYTAGRAMALSFKPLTIEDIKEAYIQGAEEMKNKLSDKTEKYRDVFEAMVEQGDDRGFAIGCPDDQMDVLKELAEYIDKQDGWKAYIDEEGILLADRV